MLLDQSNERNWVFTALKPISRVLPQSTVSRRSDSSLDTNSSCCHRLDAWSHLGWREVSEAQIATLSGRSLMYSKKKYRTKNGALRDSSINWVFFWRLLIQNHSKPSSTKKRRNKTKYLFFFYLVKLYEKTGIRRGMWSTLSYLSIPDQISELNTHNTYVCEEDQHTKLCRKLWIYQVLHLK